MYLDKLKIKNFRKYGDPGIEVEFNKDFNLLVGENDSGKSTIIDAIRKVLWTYSYEKDRSEEEDFYNKETDREIKIECIFKGLDDPEEAHHFMEWSGIDDEKKRFLKIWYIGKYNRETNSFYGEIKAGPGEEGIRIDAKALEYLKVSYLKPLRDAEDELEAKKYSRLSKILYSHETFKYDKLKDEEKNDIFKFIKRANKEIEKYFRETENCDSNCTECPPERKKRCGKKILDQINTYLDSFSTNQEILESKIGVGKDLKLKEILEKLDLKLGGPKPGLGSLNRLFIAVEFLLLQRNEYYGLKLGLIEEIEAHLHPQSQLLLIEYLQKIAENEGIQLILTTHSPNLASKVELENIILLKGNSTYPLGSDHTNLENDDYRFLQRFLDVTKANMFFANGVIMVEGPSEELLIPVLADKIGSPLTKSGVSVVNVRGKSFLRYSKIYQRKNGEGKKTIGLPVALVIDVDVKPDVDNFDEIISKKIEEKKEKYRYGEEIQVFVSPVWTLEYCLAKSGIRNLLEKAIIEAGKELGKETSGWQANLSKKEPKEIYNEYIGEGKKLSKAIIGQCLADVISREDLPDGIDEDYYVSYLFDAIKFVTK